MKTRTIAIVAAASAAISLNAAPVAVDAQAKGTPFEHYWSLGVGAGRVNEGLRSAWHEHLVRANTECGFRYVRMHDTFNDDMFVYFGDGNYSWQYIDEVYDRMLAGGVRPFVELSFFPTALAKENSRTVMWYRGHVEPDMSKYPAWGRLVEAFVSHLVERYGLDEIQNWYFEVWNEPNLYWGFFHGPKSAYFELYRVSANAVKSVHPSLKVGGPATSNFIADSRHDGEIQDNDKSVFYPQETINEQQWKGVWIEEFLSFCEKEKLPVDFISCHTYPTDYALDPVSGRGKNAIRYVHSVRDDFDYLRKTLAASAYPNAEIHITEWSTSPNSRDAMHDNLPPAAYIAKVSLDNVGKVDSLMYWTFTDIFEEKGGRKGHLPRRIRHAELPGNRKAVLPRVPHDERAWRRTSLELGQCDGDARLQPRQMRRARIRLSEGIREPRSRDIRLRKVHGRLADGAGPDVDRTQGWRCFRDRDA